ncbi:MAG: ribosome-binding factor A [bacterium]|nr:ribosome-binding factor A [bacterium]
MNARIPKVNQLLKKELSSILSREFVFPDNSLVSISRAEATPNLQQARIYITVFPADKKKEVMGILQGRVYDMQQQLNKRLKMRPVPRIEICLDEGESKAQRIHEILDSL